jgi:hypothetical protein
VIKELIAYTNLLFYKNKIEKFVQIKIDKLVELLLGENLFNTNKRKKASKLNTVFFLKNTQKINKFYYFTIP